MTYDDNEVNEMNEMNDFEVMKMTKRMKRRTLHLATQNLAQDCEIWKWSRWAWVEVTGDDCWIGFHLLVQEMDSAVVHLAMEVEVTMEVMMEVEAVSIATTAPSRRWISFLLVWLMCCEMIK